MYYVYIIYSEKFDSYYVGYSADPQKRLEERHNKGFVKSTKKNMPYKLCKTKSFATENEARKEERRIKLKKILLSKIKITICNFYVLR